MRQILFFLATILTIATYAQQVAVEGYVFESGNRGYLNEVKVIVKDAQSKQVMTTTSSDKEGRFSVNLPIGSFLLALEKDLFHPIQKMIIIDGTAPKLFEKIQMERKPGYLLDATLAEKRTKKTKQVDAITNSLIEVFNNTKDEVVMILENHPYPTFKTTFERGNHYTILIRKDGYVPKRLEAFVDIKGCILCFDGVGNVQPGVSDVLTERNQMGTLLANIELERLSATTKPEVIYGEESLLEILFMENLNSDIIEVGSDGQIKDVTTANNPSKQQPFTKVINNTAPTSNTTNNKSTKTANQATAVSNTSQVTKQTGKKTTITGIVSAPISSEKMTKEATTKIVATPEETKVKTSTVKNSTIPAAQPTPKKTVATTTQPARTTNQSTHSATVPDYKRTTSSTNTILARRNKGETLVKTADVNRPKPSKPKAVASKASIKSQGESLVQLEEKRNTAEFIPAGYTGYLVEILVSMKEVAADNPIFKQHGQVKKELRSDGGYSYLLGDFNKKKEASIFLKDVLSDRYPMAKVVYYVNGKFVGYVFIPKSTGGNAPR